MLPDEYKGKWFILFSHPADFTPVCTTEFVAFQKRYAEFRKLNTELIGLSVDRVFAHIKWEEWIKEKLQVEIEFPIIADTGKVAESLGLIHPGKLAEQRAGRRQGHRAPGSGREHRGQAAEGVRLLRLVVLPRNGGEQEVAAAATINIHPHQVDR